MTAFRLSFSMKFAAPILSLIIHVKMTKRSLPIIQLCIGYHFTLDFETKSDNDTWQCHRPSGLVTVPMHRPHSCAAIHACNPSLMSLHAELPAGAAGHDNPTRPLKWYELKSSALLALAGYQRQGTVFRHGILSLRIRLF